MLTFPDSLAVCPDDDRLPVVLGDEGAWYYEGTDIAAVGARDVTLEKAVDPLVIGRIGQDPEAVLLPLSAIIGDQRLNWALQAGTKLDGGAEPLFEVPWSVWQEHAAEPIDAWLPECDAPGISGPMAAAERDFRFAKRALDAAGLIRNQLVVLATHLGLSRREVGETLGLSTGRVQQLNEDPPSEVAKEVEEFVSAATLLAGLIGERSCPRADIPIPRELGSDQLDELVDSMLTLRLLDEATDGLHLTDDGRALIDIPSGTGAKRKERKNAMERVGDATE
jgi:hypothetical protein